MRAHFSPGLSLAFCPRKTGVAQNQPSPNAPRGNVWGLPSGLSCRGPAVHWGAGLRSNGIARPAGYAGERLGRTWAGASVITVGGWSESLGDGVLQRSKSGNQEFFRGLCTGSAGPARNQRARFPRERRRRNGGPAFSRPRSRLLNASAGISQTVLTRTLTRNSVRRVGARLPL